MRALTLTCWGGVAVMMMVVAVVAPAQVRPTTPDPWAVTTNDTTAAVRTFTAGGASLEAKLAAVIQADRERLKPRVGNAAPKASRRVWLDRTEDGKIVGMQLLDLDAYSSIRPSEDGREYEFAMSEFVVARAPRSPALEAHLRDYFQPADLTGKEAGK